MPMNGKKHIMNRMLSGFHWIWGMGICEKHENAIVSDRRSVTLFPFPSFRRRKSLRFAISL